MALSAVASAVALVCTLLIREVRHVAPGNAGATGPGAAADGRDEPRQRPQSSAASAK